MIKRHDLWLKNRNLLFAIGALGINLLVNLFLSPYVVEKLGVEANGYITLANNFVSYASLITIALNSMANRSITLEVVKKDYLSANIYYSSISIGNIVIGSITIIISFFLSVYLENILDIPHDIQSDVKMLFFLTLLTFAITTIFSTWNVATFITNKLYLQSIRNVQSQFIRAFFIVTFFYIFSVRLSWVALASLTSTIFSIFYLGYYKQKLTPYLTVKREDFRFQRLKQLLSSGIWNTVGQLGIMLLTGLDLLIANIFLGPTAMGVLALAKVLPNILAQLTTTVNNVFIPQLTFIYAEDNREKIQSYLEKTVMLGNFIITIPVSLIIVLGEDFYKLWVPSQDSKLLMVLSIFSIISLVFSSGTDILSNVFLLVDKLKINAINIVLSGFVSFLLSYFFIVNTAFGLYAIAIISGVVNIITKFLYTIPMSAKYLGIKWTHFYKYVFLSVFSVIFISIITFLVITIFLPDNASWGNFILKGLVGCFVGVIVNGILYYNQIKKLRR